MDDDNYMKNMEQICLYDNNTEVYKLNILNLWNLTYF